MSGESPKKKARTTKHGHLPATIIGDSREILPQCRRSNLYTGYSGGDALSNYLVLKNIFTNLENNDVEACCQVNKVWNAVADPLLIRYYDVKLELIEKLSEDDESDDSANSSEVTCAYIMKRASYNTEQVNHGRYSLEKAAKILQTAALTERTAVNLTICSDLMDENETAINRFFRRIGNYVEKFSVQDNFYTTTKKFCKMLVHYFPKLRTLDLLNVIFGQREDKRFDARDLGHGLKHLKIIQNFSARYDSGARPLVNLIRLAPSLEEIHGVPLRFTGALLGTEKGGCVKSLKIHYTMTDNELTAAFKHLSKLKPRLRSFSFKRPNRRFKKSVCNSATQPYLRKIIQSSHASLERLTLYEAEPFDFHAISPMIFLKEIKLVLNADRMGGSAPNIFPPGLDLLKMFPNVSAVNIPAKLGTYPILSITDIFPHGQFAQWGSQIHELKLEHVSLRILPQIKELFPAVRNLELVAKIGKQLKHMLPTIVEYWPEIQSLTVIVDCHMKSKNRCSLDSIFTGIPDGEVAQLRKSWSRTKHFSQQQIRNYKNESSIRKFSKLKILKFNLKEDTPDGRFLKTLGDLTSVSKEFGFQFHPDLKVVVQVYEDDHFEKVSGLTESLGHIIDLEGEKLEPLSQHKQVVLM